MFSRSKIITDEEPVRIIEIFDKQGQKQPVKYL